VVLRGCVCRGHAGTVSPFVRRRPNLLAGEDPAPEPRQQRSVERHRRLKEAALAMFGEKGYERTTVDDLARRARLPIGSFYQHFRSKRHLLLALMDDLVEKLGRLELQPGSMDDPRQGLRELLSRAFSTDLHYLGAYRAWQEAVLSDSELARKELKIRAWTTARVLALFEYLQRLPGARTETDVRTLAELMDAFFWGLLGRAPGMRPASLERQIGTAGGVIYHALFSDRGKKEPI
jgi:AcrR family transcriptional regulator